MSSLRDRLTFALCVLKNDQEAILILADILEETGERSLALWARSKQKTWQKRMNFVMGILPYEIALQTASDFMLYSLRVLGDSPDRSTYAGGRNSEDMQFLIQAVQEIADWSHGRRTRNSLDELCRVLGTIGPWRFGIMHIDRAMQTFHIAVNSGRIIRDSTSPPHNSILDSCKNSCRKVVKASRQLLQPYRLLVLSNYGQEEVAAEDSMPHILARWQMNRMIDNIEQAIDRL